MDPGHEKILWKRSYALGSDGGAGEGMHDGDGMGVRGLGQSPSRGPGRSPGGVRGRAPAGCGAAPHEELFELLEVHIAIFRRGLMGPGVTEPIAQVSGEWQLVTSHTAFAEKARVYDNCGKSGKAFFVHSGPSPRAY